MKHNITILLLFFYSFSYSQVDKETTFKKAVEDITNAYNKKNAIAFNRYVRKNEGVYFLVKNGVYQYWYKRKQLQFKVDNDSNYLPYPYYSMLLEQQLPSNFKLSYTSYPVFNCNSKKAKVGLYVDTSYKVNLLSNLIKKYIKFNDIGLDKSELKNELKTINEIEAESRKIIIIGKSDSNWGENFIFYLTYINQKWYISIIDFATFDCSA
jgi:hypothetical protein